MGQGKLVIVGLRQRIWGEAVKGGKMTGDGKVDGTKIRGAGWV